jgi:hypothetical protein
MPCSRITTNLFLLVVHERIQLVYQCGVVMRCNHMDCGCSMDAGIAEGLSADCVSSFGIRICKWL